MARPQKNKQALVIGTGRFPLDMMRYDRCFPASEADASKLQTILQQTPVAKPQPWAIRLSKTTDAPWTAGRWESFGCTIMMEG